MDIDISVYCEECNIPQGERDRMYCESCYEKLEERIEELTGNVDEKDKEISDLEDKIASLEKEIEEKNE